MGLVAVTAYGGFLAVVVWAIAFLADLGDLPTIDGEARRSWPAAAGIDLALLGAFAVHHSVMARGRAKRALVRVVPAALERSTYVLIADALLALVFWQWQPMDGAVWDVRTEPWRALLWTVFGTGWLVAVASTFMVDHFDLVGVRQALSRPGDYTAPPFQVRWLYRWVRHPLMLGLLVAFWATPRMSAGHLLFALASTGYIAIGVRFEEHDLERELGQPYCDYARRVPAVIPGTPRGRVDREDRRPQAPANEASRAVRRRFGTGSQVAGSSGAGRRRARAAAAPAAAPTTTAPTKNDAASSRR